MPLLEYNADLWGVFASGLLASTLLPGGSEVVLGLAAADGSNGFGALLLIATLGNTLGGMTSWGIGRFLVSRAKKNLTEDPRSHRALAVVRRWGAPALLLSWLPVIGDPLCLVAGWLRVPWLAALCFMGLGKAMRYAALLAAIASVS